MRREQLTGTRADRSGGWVVVVDVPENRREVIDGLRGRRWGAMLFRFVESASITTRGMLGPIDLILLDGDDRVHGVIPNVQPGRDLRFAPEVVTVIELMAIELPPLTHIQVGDQVRSEPAAPWQ